jgi:hypothetical protein
VGLSSEFGIFDLGLLVELGGIYPCRGAGRLYSEIPKIGVLRGIRLIAAAGTLILDQLFPV